MSTINIGDHVKGSLTSKHRNCTGIVVDPNGQFLIVKSDEDSPNPLAWSSIEHGEGKFFCLDRNLTIKLKD